MPRRWIDLQSSRFCTDKKLCNAMDAPEETPAPNSGPNGGVHFASKWMLPRLPVLIGVIGLGAVVTTGTLFKRRADVRVAAAVADVRAELLIRRTAIDEYGGRIKNLRWNADKIRSAVESATPESQKAWARERARRFDELVARIDRRSEEATFDRVGAEIDALCAQGDVAAARARLPQLPSIKFPEPAEFMRLQQDSYFKPLAEFSRQNPAYYRAFQQAEPDAASADVAALRAELTASGLEEITPQLMLKLELLSAVAPPGDPLVADWNAVASASDYFEHPDAATLALWRGAQRAIRKEDWPTAVARMQSILRTTVRTRQPYRSAYAWALLKNRPDQTAEAYPYLEEAAAAGDRKARDWIIQQDCAEGRQSEALAWLESAVGDGEAAAIPRLLELYAMKAVRRDLTREVGVLNRIISAPDAPPLATLLLARLYEEGGGVPKSAPRAFELYRSAAERGLPAAWADLARCFAHGVGTGADLEQACQWACRAYLSGEHVESVALLNELMQRDPEQTAGAVQEMFAQEQVSAPAGFLDVRTHGAGVAQLRLQVARHLDQKGDYGQAARLYAQSGTRDAAVGRRYAELTLAHPCETCGGSGKIKSSAACPTCGGKGTVLCHVCDGRGYRLVPGTPPCTTCGGSGAIVQNGRAISCSACGGTGKGQGSVIRQDCTACVQGREVCHDCVGGRISLTKECPDCHGTGARALADR